MIFPLAEKHRTNAKQPGSFFFSTFLLYSSWKLLRRRTERISLGRDAQRTPLAPSPIKHHLRDLPPHDTLLFIVSVLDQVQPSLLQVVLPTFTVPSDKKNTPLLSARFSASIILATHMKNNPPKSPFSSSFNQNPTLLRRVSFPVTLYKPKLACKHVNFNLTFFFFF